MNCFHRVVWSAARGMWVVASELAKAKIKGSTGAVRSGVIGKKPFFNSAHALLTLGLIGLSMPGLASAAISTWNFSGPGFWQMATNWDTGESPDALTLAVINNGNSVIVNREAEFADAINLHNDSSLIVEGSNTTLRVLRWLEMKNGSFDVRFGGTALIDQYRIPVGNSGTNIITVQGAGSRLHFNPGRFDIGSTDGTTLSVLNGGLLESDVNVIGINGDGAVLVDGAGSRWDMEDVQIGAFGNGTLTISNGGAVHAHPNSDILIGLDDNQPYNPEVLNPAATVNTLNIGAAAGRPAVAPGTLLADRIIFGVGTNSVVFNHTGTDYLFSNDILTQNQFVALPGAVKVYSGTTLFTGNVYARSINTGVNRTKFLGGILVKGGTLSIGNGGSAGWIDGDITIETFGTLTFDHSDTRTYSHTLMGNGTLIKEGSNTLNLTASNNDTGTVKVNDGTLEIVNGSHLDSRFDGSIGDSVVSDAGVYLSGAEASWDLGRNLFVGRDGDGRLTINNSSNVTDALGIIGHQVGSSGNATVIGAGSTWINTDSLVVGNGGNASLIISDGALVTATSGGVGLGSTGNGTVTINDSGSVLRAGILKVGSQGEGTLNLINGGAADISGQLTIAESAGSFGTVNIGAAAGETAVAAGILSADSIHFGSGTGKLVFNHTGNYDISNNISGSGSVDVYSGINTLSGTNTYSGDTTIHGGTQIVGTGGSTGSLAGDIINNSALMFSHNNASTYVGAISGSGSLTLNNNLRNTTLTLTGNHTYSGDTVINKGTLAVGNGGTTGSLIGNISSTSAGRLVFNRSDDFTYAGAISGRGSVIKNGAGILNLTGSTTLATLMINGGQVTIDSGGQLTSDSFSDYISGSNDAAGVLVDGAGSSWSATRISVDGGAITIRNGGEVTTRASSFFHDYGLTLGGQDQSSGTLNIGGAAGDAAGTVGTLSAERVIFGPGSGQIVFNHTDTDYDFTPDIAGNGSVELYSGVTTLSGNNTYSGSTTVSGGMLKVNNFSGSATGSSDVLIAGGAGLGGGGIIAGTVTEPESVLV